MTPVFSAPQRAFGRTGQLLSGTAAALFLAFGSLAPVSDAQASIVYSGAVNIAAPLTTAGIYINLVTGVADFTPGGAPGWDVNVWGGALRVYTPNDGGVVANLGSSAVNLDNLSPGTRVGSSSIFAPYPGSAETTGATSFVLNSSANYIGIAFFNEGTNTRNYGWMQFSLGSAYINTARSIVGWAYEDTGADIQVGATVTVPEPGTLGLLAGSLGLLALSRARRLR